METISNRFSSIKSSISNYASPKKAENPQKLGMRYFRTRMSTVDDIIKANSDPHELILGLSRVSDLIPKRRLQTEDLRKETIAEIQNVRHCMNKLEEEQRMQAERMTSHRPVDRKVWLM